MTSEERLEYDMWMLGREDLPNSELNEEDLEILGLGIENGYTEEGKKKIELGHNGNENSNENQFEGNVVDFAEEDAMDLD